MPTLYLYRADTPPVPKDYGSEERRREIINAAALARRAAAMQRVGKVLFWAFIVAAVVKAIGVAS